jgi:outer membrane protein assembly factor BamB
MSRVLAAVVVLCLPALALAGKVKTYTASAPAHFEKAQLHEATVSSEGTVRLARLLKPYGAQIDATRVWDAVEDARGNMFVATGDEGKIFKISPEGKVRVAFDSEDSQILCLLAAADGSVFAGTGPSGLIVRIDPTGNAKVLYDSPESYVWALAFDEATKTVFAATGPHGRIYAIDSDGKAYIFFQSNQDHILSLARAGDGTLYAGTDKQGLVYRIDQKGKAFVLFQAAQAEVRCLQLADGALYAGTSSPAGSRGSAGSSSSGSGSLSLLPRNGPVAARTSTDGHTEAAALAARESNSESERGASSSPVPAPRSGDNSVYRVGFDGSVREIFREKGLVLSLHKQGDRLYVATGAKGQLFEINEATRERNEVARLDHGQVHRLLLRRDGTLVVAASEPAKLYALRDQFVGRGSVLSEPIDAKLVSRWGALSWQAELPAKTEMTVALRSGNVATPDETWSPWSAELSDPRQATAGVPNARFLQYRITLSTTDPAASPAIHALSIRYATMNQAPEITSVDVPSPDAAGNSKDPKRLKIKWSATDPNEDELVFDLFVKKDSWKDWVRIEESWTKTDFEWDTATVPSGVYQFKVVASDRPDNNEDAALTGERVAGPVIVAHEPPVVNVKLTGIEGGRASFEASAGSNMIRLASAAFAINGGKWTDIYPSDGLFDSKTQTFRFRSEILRPGSYVLVLKVRDAAGNVGSADAIFSIGAPK